MRYYYKKDGKPAYNLKEPLENILADTTGYVQIDEEEWNSLQPVRREPTAAEVAKREKLKRIAFLKGELARTDYEAIKYAEGWFTDTDYAEIKAQRQAWRDEINELEAELA